MINVKKCSKCHIKKNNECFSKHSKTKDGLQSWCKECVRKLDKERSRNDPKRIEQIKNFNYNVRHKALLIISNGEIKCVNCGCDDERMIEINHKNGGGGKEKKACSAYTFYNEIIKNKRKIDDLELTCRVCNALHYLKLKFGKTKHKVIWS